MKYKKYITRIKYIVCRIKYKKYCFCSTANLIEAF